jgi:hypothetical protein
LTILSIGRKVKLSKLMGEFQMGHATAAFYTLEAIGELLDQKASNGMPDGGYYQRGDEQPDGAIIGTVYRVAQRYTQAEREERARNMSRAGVAVRPSDIGDRCVPRGVFRIEADGKVTRFPGLTRSLLKQAEQKGAQKRQFVHGTPDWRELREVVTDHLTRGAEPVSVFDTLQEIVRGYQVENHIMFMGLPNLTKPDILTFLNGLSG